MIRIDFLFYIIYVYIYIHVVGGSSYTGGCKVNPAYPITYESGVTGTVPGSQTMPGGSTRSDYISGVGVGKVGTYATLQSPGGNGAIVLTFIPTAATPSFSPTTAQPTIDPSSTPSTALPTYAPSVEPTTAQPTYAPSFSPTTSQPTYAPSFSPTTAVPTYAPSFSPTTAQPIFLPDRPTNQLPICRDGSTLHCSCQWTFSKEQEHMFLEDSPDSNDVYQPESLDTALPFLSSEIKYVVRGFVTGITSYKSSYHIVNL